MRDEEYERRPGPTGFLDGADDEGARKAAVAMLFQGEHVLDLTGVAAELEIGTAGDFAVDEDGEEACVQPFCDQALRVQELLGELLVPPRCGRDRPSPDRAQRRLGHLDCDRRIGRFRPAAAVGHDDVVVALPAELCEPILEPSAGRLVADDDDAQSEIDELRYQLGCGRVAAAD